MKIDEGSFKQFYSLYFESICRFLGFYTYDLYAVEEVAQEVFLKLWDERDSIEISHIKTYLFTSAKNRMLNYLRDKNNRNTLLMKWASQEARKNNEHDCVDKDDFLLLLKAAVNNLPPKCQQIYLLSRDESFSYKEIADLLNLSVKTIENQMGIAIKRIHKYIADRAGQYL